MRHHPADTADARPVLFGTGAATAFGHLHAAAKPRRDVAVVLVPPFGWEDMCSYRPRRAWAHDLAGAGYATLRLDLPGTGDSPGSPRDPGRLDAWTDAVGAGADLLREATGCTRVVAVGLGLGALVAYRAAAAGMVDDLALWGAQARGRRVVRELRAFAAVETAAESDLPRGVEEGGFGVAGYLLAPETVAALEAVDLSAVPLPGAPDRRVLLLERDGRGVDGRLREALENSGAALSIAPGDGYARMLMVEPQESRPSDSALAAIRGWLDAFAGHAEGPGPAPPADPPVLQLVHDGVALRETPLEIAHPFGTLSGMLTEPAGSHPRLTLLLLNAGPQRRTGPNRMWVELARRWGARGVATLRVDLAGIGDAAGGELPFDDVLTFYRPEFPDQVTAALDALDERGFGERVVTGGLCAGGWWSLQGLQHDDRVVAAMLLNTGTLMHDGGWRRTRYETEVLVRKALRPSTWRRVVRGQTTFRIHARTLRRLAHAAITAPARLLRRRRDDEAGDPIDALLDDLRERDKRLLLVFAGDEPLHQRMAADGQIARLQRWPNVSLHHMPLDADVHTMRPLAVQQAAHELVDAALERQLAALGEGSAASPVAG